MRRRRWVIGVISLAVGAGLLLMSLPTTSGGRATSAATPEPLRPPPVTAPPRAPSSPAPVITASAEEPPLARFEGEVVDTDGVPVASAEIAFFDETTSVVRSDANGRFVFDAPDGLWSLTVSAPGYLHQDDERSYLAAHGAVFGGLRFELERSRQIRGTIRTPAGKPVQGARLNAMDEVTFSLIGVGTRIEDSDATGRFEFQLTAQGRNKVSLSIWHSCCLIQYEPIPPGDADVTLNVTLVPVTGPKTLFSGIVVTETNAAVPDAEVVVSGVAVTDAGSVMERETTRTDQLGKFSVPVRSTEVRVLASAGDRVSLDDRSVMTSEFARVVLGPKTETLEGVIAGRVQDQRGQPVRRFGLVVSESDVLAGSRPFLTGNGRYEVRHLTPGDYTVEIESDDFATSAPVEVTVEAGRRTDGVDFVLASGATLSGAVFDERTHLPLAGVRVDAEIRSATTDAAGRFELHALPSELLQVEANREGYATRQLKVDMRRVATLTIELRRLEGRDGGWKRDYEGIGAMLEFGTQLDGGNGYEVKELHPEGGARLAGVQLGDEILAADGVVPFGLSIEEFLLHIKGEEGSVVRLTIRRGGRVFDVNVARRRLTW